MDSDMDFCLPCHKQKQDCTMSVMDVLRKVASNVNFAKCSTTMESYEINFYELSLVTHSIIHNLKNFITLPTEPTKLCCFSHDSLAVETLSKIISAMQDSANTKC